MDEAICIKTLMDELMRATHRSLDLIDKEVADEFVSPNGDR